jgi:tail tube protein
MTNFFSDQGYLAVKPQASAGVPIIPTNFVPLVSESIKTVQNLSTDKRLKGRTWGANDLLKGARTHEGEIVIEADPDNLGHFLNMLITKGVTTGDASDGYTHPFTVGDPDNYSIEFNRGAFAQRIMGVQASEMRLEFQDNRMVVRAQIQGLAQFSVATLGVALTGAGMTSLVLDDKYDRQPTRGLVVGDKLVIGTDEVTILTIDADGVTITFASATLTYSTGEEIHLKAQTPSYTGLRNAFNIGNMLVGIGADETTATSNAGAIATATPVHDFAIILNRNVLTIPRSGRVDPVEIIRQSLEGQIEMKQLLISADQRQKFLDKGKQALTLIVTGEHIKTDFTTEEKLTFKFHNVKLMENSNVLAIGEYILDDQRIEVLYDDTDAKAIAVELVNKTAGTDY